MRILLVSDFLPPTPGGLEAHVRRLAESLIRRGQSVAIVSGTPQPDPLPGDAPVHYAPTIFTRAPIVYANKDQNFPPPFPDPVFRRVVRKVAESWKPDVIHAHGWCSFSSHWAESPPLIVTLHDHGMRCSKRTLLRAGRECSTGIGLNCMTCAGDQSAVKRTALAEAMHWSVPKLAAHASKFIAVSQSVAQHALEGAVDEAKITVIPNFCDTATREPRVVPTEPTVLFVGPGTAHKGRSVAVAAFSQLPPRAATLVLVGSKTPVRADGVVNLGYLHGTQLMEQYQRATIAVMPAIWPEPCPTVLLEAMAHGLPVIGSRVGGIPDLIEHGVSGLLVPPNDPGYLAESMRALLADRDLLHKLGIGARERSLKFDTEAVVPRVMDVYESVLGEGEIS